MELLQPLCWESQRQTHQLAYCASLTASEAVFPEVHWEGRVVVEIKSSHRWYRGFCVTDRWSFIGFFGSPFKNSCTTWMLTQSALILWMRLFITLLYSLDMAWVQGDSGAARHLPRITLNSRGEGYITGRTLKEHGQRSSLHHPGRVLRDLPFPEKWTCEQSTCTLWVLELGGHCKQRSCLSCFTLKRTF